LFSPPGIVACLILISFSTKPALPFGFKLLKAKVPIDITEMIRINTLKLFDINLPQVYHEISMRLKLAIIFSFILSLSLLNPFPALARKKLVRRLKSITPVKTPWVKLKLRSDRNALLLMLGGMHYAESVSYILTYDADPAPQGIESYHTPADGNTQKELLFGTCSNTDCTYHQDISDMIFEITIQQKDGQTLFQKYQINP